MIKNFRIIAYLEGLSYLILLLVAMPLKYFYGMPLAVRIVGATHGGLFIAYCFALKSIRAKLEWSDKITAIAFISAFLPAAPFIFDRKILAEAEAED